MEYMLELNEYYEIALNFLFNCYFYLYVYLIASSKSVGHSYLLPLSLAVRSDGPKGS